MPKQSILIKKPLCIETLHEIESDSDFSTFFIHSVYEPGYTSYLYAYRRCNEAGQAYICHKQNVNILGNLDIGDWET